ncbi:DUF927 domain-containing protein [Silicimonas sp. MF1-12-2]|uniref:DUF927 domain-containing protein n=1 Tax=Silicimonas sp. MF1-12-2 TaxID=3384793 RepID=UPI0039B6C4A6
MDIKPFTLSETDDLPEGYKLKKGGIYYEVEGKDDDKPEWKWLCSEIRLSAETRSSSSDDWGRLIEIRDNDGVWHRWAAPATLYAVDLNGFISECVRLGMSIAPGRRARETFQRLIQTWKLSTRAVCTDRLGWSDESCAAFALGDGRVIGNQAVVFQSENVKSAAAEIRSSGTLEDWRDGVAALCVGNPLMTLGVSLAFAGPLLEPLSMEGGGIHLRGQSSQGKTSIQRAAVSVWGSPGFLQTWRTTDNAAEGTAAMCNSTLIALDEMGQVEPKVAGQTAYTLANGKGKGRATVKGVIRPSATWRTLILSSGELSLADKMAEDGRKPKAGQDVRLLDIAATNRTHGVFDSLHGMASGAAFADAVKIRAAQQYGTAGPEFVRRLIADKDAAVSEVRAGIEHFCEVAKEKLGLGNDGQIARAAARLGLIAAAGEVATIWGLTGWPDGAAIDAAMDALKAWVDGRGGSGSAEEREAVQRVVAFLNRYGDSRFQREADTHIIQDRAGWFADGVYYIHDDAWRKIHAGNDHQAAARTLRDLGYLKNEATKLMHRSPRFVKNRTRCFAVLADILGADNAKAS